MLQNLLYLAVIITVVYSDCCPKSLFETEVLCTDNSDIECHMKHYGIYCCNSNVVNAIKRFADISVEIVSLSHT